MAKLKAQPPHQTSNACHIPELEKNMKLCNFDFNLHSTATYSSTKLLYIMNAYGIVKNSLSET